MFDLEQHIRQWRAQFEDSPNYGSADIDELETHLRAETEKLAESELSPEESFWIACHRLGPSAQLEMEFAKNNIGLRWRKRLSWALGGYFMIHLLALSRWMVSSLVYAVHSYLPAPDNPVLSFLSSSILAPLAAIYGDGWHSDPTLSPYILFDIFWQFLLMGTIATMIFSIRFRAIFNFRPLLDRLSSISNKKWLLTSLLALLFLPLGKLGTNVLTVRYLDSAVLGSTSVVNAVMVPLWIAFLIFLFVGLVLQSDKQELVTG